MFARLKNMLQEFLQQADLILLGLCMVSTLYGLVLIASATHYLDVALGVAKSLRYVGVQAVAMVLGIVVYIFLSMVDVEDLVRKWKWLLLFNVVFICLLRTPLGISGNTGNRAWLAIPGIPFNIQPAEVVKITFILLLAKQIEWTWQERRELKSARAVLPPTFHLLFMVGLIYVVSSDMGSALVYIFIFICMMLAAGVAWRWFAIGGVLSGLGIFTIYKLGRIPSYMLARFRVLFDHEYDPLDKGWQQSRSILAIGSGRLFGQGLFHGTQTQSSASHSLPERRTDLIFAVAGEELGFVGCLAIILLLAAIIFRCLIVAKHARTPYANYVCVGMAGMLIFQTVENIGMCLYVMPVIGLTLPFFSYGGSSLVTLYAAMGIVSAIKKRAMPERSRFRGRRI